MSQSQVCPRARSGRTQAVRKSRASLVQLTREVLACGTTVDSCLLCSSSASCLASHPSTWVRWFTWCAAQSGKTGFKLALPSSRSLSSLQKLLYFASARARASGLGPSVIKLEALHCLGCGARVRSWRTQIRGAAPLPWLSWVSRLRCYACRAHRSKQALRERLRRAGQSPPFLEREPQDSVASEMLELGGAHVAAV